jgi:hypothetical protein
MRRFIFLDSPSRGNGHRPDQGSPVEGIAVDQHAIGILQMRVAARAATDNDESDVEILPGTGHGAQTVYRWRLAPQGIDDPDPQASWTGRGLARRSPQVLRPLNGGTFVDEICREVPCEACLSADDQARQPRDLSLCAARIRIGRQRRKGQAQGECGPLVGDTRDIDLSAHQFGKIAGDRQAQPSTAEAPSG